MFQGRISGLELHEGEYITEFLEWNISLNLICVTLNMQWIEVKIIRNNHHFLSQKPVMGKKTWNKVYELYELLLWCSALFYTMKLKFQDDKKTFAHGA